METTNTKRRRWLIGGIVAAVAAALYFGEKKVKKDRHKGLKGTDEFELSTVDYYDGNVTPLYDVTDFYGDDYDKAYKWLKKELAKKDLEICDFWPHDDDTYGYEAKDKPKDKKSRKGTRKTKGLKGTDDEMFEISSVDGERGCVTPLYDDADLYGDDYDRAKKWLRKELKADGLKIDKFWINEADGCWEFISKPNRK